MVNKVNAGIKNMFAEEATTQIKGLVAGVVIKI
jgi:hypothetical protein